MNSWAHGLMRILEELRHVSMYHVSLWVLDWKFVSTSVVSYMIFPSTNSQGCRRSLLQLCFGCSRTRCVMKRPLDCATKLCCRQWIVQKRFEKVNNGCLPRQRFTNFKYLSQVLENYWVDSKSFQEILFQTCDTIISVTIMGCKLTQAADLGVRS